MPGGKEELVWGGRYRGKRAAYGFLPMQVGLAASTVKLEQVQLSGWHHSKFPPGGAARRKVGEKDEDEGGQIGRLVGGDKRWKQEAWGRAFRK